MYAEISARIELLAKINVQLIYASENEKMKPNFIETKARLDKTSLPSI